MNKFDEAVIQGTTVLEGWARQGRTGTYREFSDSITSMEFNYAVPTHRAVTGKILDIVSRKSLNERGCLLSALVVKKATRRPSKGFFTLTDEVLTPKDFCKKPDTLVLDEQAKVFTAYAA